MAKEYYCLVAGLREYSLESDNKGFDAAQIRADILEQLSNKDAGYVRLFYNVYDIENIINMKAGRSRFNTLGSLTREQMEDELKMPTLLPRFLANVVEAYTFTDNTDYEDVDTSKALERSLFEAYYDECAKSKCRFIKEWYEFDRNLRNIGAAYTARRTERTVADVVVGDGLVADKLAKSSAADFGLKGEVGYIDQVVAAVDEGDNLVEKEHKIDLIRWEMSDELTLFDYFNINRILAYLVKVNIVNRWAEMDEKAGRRMFERLIGSLSGKEAIERTTVD